MLKPLVVSIPGEMERAGRLAESIEGDLAKLNARTFPDGETYIRLDSEIEDRDVIVTCSLDRPNEKFLPLAYVAETVRDLGARQVGLVSPYLAYMRQDSRFRKGEGVTSRYFGALISDLFDWLVTVEPHLHRHRTLDHLYAIPSHIVRVGESIAAWIEDHLEAPILVGPDEEAQQWVSSVCDAGGFDSMILEKVRHGDYDVQITGSGEAVDTTRQPVIVDDIISTGRTMIEAVRHLKELGYAPPICLGIHGLFAGDALEQMRRADVAEVVTCNTVRHETNQIDVGPHLAAMIQKVVRRTRSQPRVQGGAI